ncbi:M43 family zinc metalloprotease [Algoriphagus sp. D3-2-R+10]|uniref:M43 family zinc metalloprotease n=1 Tax=Algoriphagus aurantiacus TaxID=3103948 RepID=UPI002B3BB218|nr:M43 family zinc metalloprotease [Algoriphagus sp. D3-2-R+10]MEB2774160.1 M43 family zinc metalloprotease [Algoriphagus sp. D3-2-R+10]
MRSSFFILALLLSTILDAPCQISDQGNACLYLEEPTRDEKIALAKEFRAWSASQNNTLSSNDLEIWTVPIVFHVISSDLPSLAYFENAVSELNDAFANRGSFNTSQGADTGIQFCLASTAPDGGATTGVNHIPSDYQNTDKDLDHRELVNHSKWDATRYINVWLVKDITGEALAYYEGENWWTRLGVGGYASRDGVVATSAGAGLLAHEIGHYFGLLHTWAGRDCKNDDCLVDGDMVCDTPPDKSVAEPCGGNSCDTDVLSNFSNGNFFTDVADMSTNFMDYSPCKVDFTLGQAERMRFTLESTYPSLFSRGLSHPLCETPCDDNAAVQIYMDRQYPIPGENVFFTNELSGNITNPTYKWFVTPLSGDWSRSENPSNQVSASSNLSYSFANEGLYRVTLQVLDANDPTCFVSFSMNVNVSCGVDSRFYPDKRLIASKQPHALFTDSVTFTNRSYNGSSFEWTITHQNFNSNYPSLPPFRSEETNLTYYFKEPGDYQISLLARNGNCLDESNTFLLKVDDPTIDGSPEISQVTCLNEDSFQVAFTLYNYGYDTVNVNTPVAFYDANPSQSTSAQLLGVWKLPKIVYGFDEEDFSAVVEGDIRSIQELFMVFNDTGTVDLPLVFPPGDQDQLSVNTIFPPSGYSELRYDNNYSSYLLNSESFAPFSLSSELDQPSCPGNSDGVIRISAEGGSGTYNYAWDHDPELLENTASGLAAGTYTVEVSDPLTCAFELLEFELIDPEPIEITVEPILVPTTCAAGNDGEVILKLSGAVGELQVIDYPSVWDGETLTVSGISEGDLSLSIQDESGCKISFDGEMTGPEPLQVNFIQKSPSCPGKNDGELIAEVTGGTAPYTYLWAEGSTSQTLTGLDPGIFEVTITDSNGCTIAASGEVEQAVPQVRMPTGFNPQEGPYFPVFTCEITFKLMVWNRWGQLVYAGSEGWDGKISGVESLLGGYSYLLQFSYVQDNLIKTGELRGGFVLIR